jgi:hypothetical protein
LLLFGSRSAVLIQPKSGVILAIDNGTQYNLRLPGFLGAEAIKLGAETCTKWNAGDEMDAKLVLGEDWIFGAFLSEESNWCKKVYELYNNKP